MKNDDFEKEKQVTKLRETVLQVEQERVSKAETISIAEAKEILSERAKKEVPHSNK